ncbi:MAG: type II toxin-antitoxin system PemK/MazF family toxin [candidate division SR1 bacterium]|nr:type II toxin-antitoxin system PemK/MazF family toxin [candidate division SR1 bacterium]
MEKSTDLFDGWNQAKQHIHFHGATGDRNQFYINAKEVRYVKLGINVGYEQDGKSEFKRAILVIKKLGNLFLILPMTTKEKDNSYHYKLGTFRGRMSWIILSQIKTIDRNRFIEKIGEISYKELKNIKKNLSSYYFSDSL